MQYAYKEVLNDTKLESKDKPNANETTLITIYAPIVEKSRTMPKCWYKGQFKEKVENYNEGGEVLGNFVVPNRPILISAYSDNTLDIVVKEIKLNIDVTDVKYKDCVVVITVTNDPYICKADEVISLGYHTLKIALSDVTIGKLEDGTIKFTCSALDYKVKIGVPQH